MNHFIDQAIILSVRPHGEAGAVVTCLTENYGRCSGYVNGAQSSQKLRSMLQIGNRVRVDWQAKGDDTLGRFQIESEHDISAIVMDDPKALLAIQSLCALITMFLPEREPYSGLYHGTYAFLDYIKTDEWPPLYVIWEMKFLNDLGYGIDISKCVVTGVTDNITYVSPKSGCGVCDKEAEPYKSKLLEIPQFMLGNGIAEGDIIKGLKLTGYFLIHRVIQHSTYQQLPEARNKLEGAFLP